MKEIETVYISRSEMEIIKDFLKLKIGRDVEKMTPQHCVDEVTNILYSEVHHERV